MKKSKENFARAGDYVANKLMVGITGASGAQLGIHLLKIMKLQKEWEIHVILSDAARKTIAVETKFSPSQVEELADHVHDIRNIGDGPASGSYGLSGMVVAPCSMKTLAGIHSGYSDNLLLRAADTIIKEGKPLVLCPRETPLSPIHLRNMLELSQIGVRIVPPMLTYYISSPTVENMTHHCVGKLLGFFGLDVEGFQCWTGLKEYTNLNKPRR